MEASASAIVMVISKAATVDEYVSELPADRREVITRLRRLAKSHLVGFREGIRWGMVNFYRSEEKQVSFASQVRYVSVYFGPAVLDAHRSELAGVDAAKGCVRFPSPVSIDWELITVLLREAAKGAGSRRASGRS
jgi:uncharacterized protein YdhG (YjbR/CyaY superfamily)